MRAFPIRRVGLTAGALAFLIALSGLMGSVGLSGPLAPAPASAQDLSDVRMLAEPGVSADHMAFQYDGDLWVAGRDGSDVRRITTHDGRETNPRFSPDGRWLAFTGEYDGNADVYVVPVEGGAPTRLTWHPGADQVRDWTPDGSGVLFLSQRAVHTNRHAQLYIAPVDGGMPEQLPIPSAYAATFSPDGSRIAYTPLAEAMGQWKNYRGGRTSRIWLYDRASHEVTEIPQPEGRSNDTDPIWLDGTVYFRSDRNGEFNLFSYDVAAGTVAQLTEHTDFPILAMDGDGRGIVYEQAGWLHSYDPGSGRTTRLQVALTSDFNETRPRYVSGDRWIRNYHVSPSGVRAVFEYRGDIVTVPAEKGDVRFLTETSDAHDRSPAWSPDGTRVAWFSDASGEYELVIAPQDGRGEVRRFPIDGAGFYEDPKWSPDGTRISFTDNSWTLYWLDVASGDVTEVASEPFYGPVKTLHHAWSPDSRWLAYTLNTPTYFQQVHLYSLDTGESHAITDGLADVGEPVFDAGGRYLWFSASTDAGPVRQWFAQSSADMDLSQALYLAVLPAGVESPLKPESDEEVAASASDEAAEDGEVVVEIEFDDLAERIVTVPVGDGVFRELAAGAEGQLYYLRAEEDGGWGLRRFSLDSREEETLLPGATTFALSADHQKVLARVGSNWLIGGAAAPIDPSEGRLATGDIEIRIDPTAEWAQMLREAWRINRDYFYDPGMHGAEWPAVWETYAQFIPHMVTRADLNRVIEWMLSELAVGHSYSGGGDFPADVDRVPGGLLGADYEVADGRYRFARVYGGLNWNPQLTSPLTVPGVDVDEGEYLLAVDGRDLRPPENLFRRFENTAGKQVEITVGPRADGRNARTVTVVPIESETALRNRAWVEGNIEKVHAATDGRVAYVYVPNTAGLGHEYFKRYFFPQAHLDGIIVDERYNGGGSVADYYIDLLDRPYIAHWNTRYGADIKTPIASIQGPKVMIIDETAGSGGDLLPWMFRQFEMGPLVGRRTWGGLVGILGFPPLLDGGSVTAPNLAIWTEDGFIVENEGVPPDIEVEQLPRLVIDGHDPQLERAIEEALRLLRENPPPEYERPPYPDRAGGG
ncbi:MAG: PDZ domain-containing protein [Longimicrobiales bacterium]